MGRTKKEATIGDKIRSIRRDVATWADKDISAKVETILNELYAAVYYEAADNKDRRRATDELASDVWAEIGRGKA